MDMGGVPEEEAAEEFLVRALWRLPSDTDFGCRRLEDALLQKQSVDRGHRYFEEVL